MNIEMMNVYERDGKFHLSPNENIRYTVTYF